MTLAELRKRASLTQSEVAAKLNIRQNAISQWESGKTFPGKDMLLPLADIYQCGVEELLRAAEPKERTQA